MTWRNVVKITACLCTTRDTGDVGSIPGLGGPPGEGNGNPLVKTMVFPAVMYRCESWTIKKAEHWKIDAFDLWCWRRLLRVPWTARRSNQSILKEISSEDSLKGLMLKQKHQYFGHLMWELTHWKRLWCLERLKVGGEGSDRGWDGWMASPTQWTWVWTNSRTKWRTGRPSMLQYMGSQRVRHERVNKNQQYSCLQNIMDRGAWWAIQSVKLQRIGHDWAN